MSVFRHYLRLCEELGTVTYDARHPEPGLTHWSEGGAFEFIDPQHGFFFHAHDRVIVLHSERNPLYSAYVVDLQLPHALPAMLGGKVDLDSKTITLFKDATKKEPNSLQELPKALRELTAHGVTEDFKVKGVPNDIGSTVGSLLKTH